MAKIRNFIAMILLAVLVIPMTIQISQLSPAQAAPLDVPVYLKVYAEPNPVGIGQTVYISLFFTKPIPVPGAFGGGSLYTGLTLNLVKPDGTNTTLGPYTSDTTGGVGGIEFVPTVTGNYTVQAFYAGQVLTGGGGYNILPTKSEPDYFTVQTEAIPTTPLTPLPTEYWSRPIYATNYAWSVLGGNWWGLSKPAFTDTGGYDASGNNFNPYSEAPNSAHIMWVKQNSFGGQVGLPVSGDQESHYTSTSILYRQFEPVILNGIIYYKVYTNTPTTETSVETPGWNAVDLRTGQLVWHKDTKDTLDFGFVMQFHTIQEYGTQAFLVGSSVSPALFSTGTGQWQLFDPMTGYFIANITDVPATAASGLVETRDDSAQGAVYMYRINSTDPTKPTLLMWNSTRCLSVGSPSFFGTSDPSAVTIRPSGNMSYSGGYQWATPIPTSMSTGTFNPALSIAAQNNDIILLRSYPQSLSTFANEFGGTHEIECAMDATTGQLLWGPVNRTLAQFHEIAPIAIGDGYYVEHDKDTNQAYVYDTLTGKQIGGTIQLEGNALSTLSRAGAIAYGKCYIWDFGGYVNAIDLKTATVAWTYVPESAGYDTPYGVYPIWHFGSHSIADGKLFLSQGRMYDPPLFAGAKKLAINCTDGSLVWTALGTYAREPSVIADGYMVGYNSYDAQIYTFGKGPTQLTVSAPQVGVQTGRSIVISGTITDISSGTKDNDRSARFPNGIGCVSDDSMSSWMEYVYMQQSKPTNATGVSITLHVVDANGNYREIGTTTSTTEGYFTFDWKPDIPGEYVVYASFAGSQSYWPSQAVTSFAADEVVTPTSTPTTEHEVSVTDQYFIPAVAAIIIVIIIVGALNMLLQRKKA
jgi:hypothetical protein